MMQRLWQGIFSWARGLIVVFGLSTLMWSQVALAASQGGSSSAESQESQDKLDRTPASSTGLEFDDDKPWSGQSELSFLSTMGNTDVRTIGFKASGKRNWAKWALVARGEFLETRNGKIVTAESYLLGTRGTRKFSEVDVFLDLEYQSNLFAGFEDLYKVSFGVGREFLKTDFQALRLEAGPAFVFEDRVTGDTRQFSSLSAQLLHRWALATSVQMNNRLSYLGNLSDLIDSRYELELGFSAPVSDMFSLKAAYLAQYKNLPPENAKNFDGKTTLSLLATF